MTNTKMLNIQRLRRKDYITNLEAFLTASTPMMN